MPWDIPHYIYNGFNRFYGSHIENFFSQMGNTFSRIELTRYTTYSITLHHCIGRVTSQQRLIGYLSGVSSGKKIPLLYVNNSVGCLKDNKEVI
jgi:hypothetical protein